MPRISRRSHGNHVETGLLPHTCDAVFARTDLGYGRLIARSDSYRLLENSQALLPALTVAIL